MIHLFSSSSGFLHWFLTATGKEIVDLVFWLFFQRGLGSGTGTETVTNLANDFDELLIDWLSLVVPFISCSYGQSPNLKVWKGVSRVQIPSGHPGLVQFIQLFPFRISVLQCDASCLTRYQTDGRCKWWIPILKSCIVAILLRTIRTTCAEDDHDTMNNKWRAVCNQMIIILIDKSTTTSRASRRAFLSEF